MIENNPQLTIEQLRNNITSKKGTTESAINIFDRYNVFDIINKAEIACYNRAQELSQLYAGE